MKLAFSTNAYTRFPLVDAIRDIAAVGYAGVEILADAPHAYPEAIDAELIKSVRDVLDETGIAVSNINCNCSFGYWTDAPPEPYFEPSLISPNPKHCADRVRLILKSLEFAREIGAKNVSITSGRCLPGTPPERAAVEFAKNIAPILERAEQLDINVGIECEPGLYIEYVTELCEWIDRTRSKRLGANLDIGHSVVIGESIATVVNQLRGRIWNMHVEDLPGRKHYHTIPGDGTLDWPELWRAVRATNYDRFATVELYTETADPHRAARRSYEFLTKSIAS